MLLTLTTLPVYDVGVTRVHGILLARVRFLIDLE
jgi:hypothetical protein